MPVVEFTDKGGNKHVFREVDGVLYPKFSDDDSIRRSLNAEGRDDDILLVNYPKSGTHWLWEILSMMVKRSTETVPRIKQTQYLEALTPEALGALPSPRVLNTHALFRNLSPDMKRRKVKVVLIHRNPKDVAVSLYNHEVNLVGLYDFQGSWEHWLPMFLDGKVSSNSWFDYVRNWEKAMEENPDYPTHLMFYENLKENGPEEIERLSKFLELGLSPDMCRAISDKCEFSNMKKDKMGLEDEFWTNVWRDSKPGFYRKGEVGDWKNWFTVAQNEQFDALYAERMKGSKLKFRLEPEGKN